MRSCADIGGVRGRGGLLSSLLCKYAHSPSNPFQAPNIRFELV